MIVYYRNVRTQDEEKKEALFEATVKLVNEIGFVSSSVSKIAKEANVSPSTVYVYYKNKEDLLVSIYIQIKAHMGKVILEGFDESMPIRDFFKMFFRVVADHSFHNPAFPINEESGGDGADAAIAADNGLILAQQQGGILNPIFGNEFFYTFLPFVGHGHPDHLAHEILA